MMLYIQLGLTALCPAILSALLYRCNKRTRFSALPERVKQAVYGLAFGLLAVLGTEYGVYVDGALISARDAAPLCAGLIFGAPAGVLAGVIGGVERYAAALWGAETYTRLGASLTTLFAGLLSAALRRWMFDNKRPAWHYGLAAGFVLEVVNMLLVFSGNMQDVHQAFTLVERCVLPMTVLNAGAVTLAMLTVSLLAGEHVRAVKAKYRHQLAQTFSRWLLVCVVLAFIVSSLFIYGLQSRLAVDDAEKMLSIYIEDVRDDVNDASDENLLRLTRMIRDELERIGNDKIATLRTLLEAYGVSEINIINKNGAICSSTTPAYWGFDMSCGAQSAEFLVLLDGTSELVQRYQPVSHETGVPMKYAAATLKNGGFVQVGYDSQRFQADIDEQVAGITRNRHVGENGFMLVANEDLQLVSDPDGHEGLDLDVTGIHLESADGAAPNAEGQLLLESVYGEDCYVMYGITEGYYIIGVMPKSEVVFGRNISLYITVFIEILVFAVLFVLIYLLVKKLVVENIQKVNHSLKEITGGNLNVSVDVRTNEEFVSLSDDINSTVHTLKGYIAEAASRIDKELEFAKTIQFSTLPCVFPPYPDRTDFDIFASMDTAKEVGGDFYDFYLLDENRLAFLIADVSGKGISAAMFMMKAKTLLKGHAENESDAAVILMRANADLCENNEAEMFVTCWMGILDFRTHKVHFANAGHNPPLVRHQNGRYEYFRTRPGFVLAGMEGTKYRSGELELLPGDEIFLYTDGVTEATDAHEQLYGDARLEAVLNRLAGVSAKELCLGVKQDVDAFVGEAPQFDDMTMLCLRLTPKCSLTVDPREDTMQDVVSFVEETLAQAEVPMKAAVKMNIAVDEIYSNIQRYSGATSATLECTAHNGRITLVFTDNGSPYNPLEQADPDTTLSAEERETGGLGIFMVKKTMDDVVYEYSEGANRLTLKKNW